MKKYRSLRIAFFSVLIDRKAVITAGILLILSLLLFVVSIGVGSLYIPPLDVVKALAGQGSDMHELVIFSFRMPRVLLAFLVGAALAFSGAVLQGIVRNPLASPDILGITGGAGLATVSFLALFSDRANSLTVGIQWLPAAACAGAVLTGILVMLLSWKKGIRPIRLILVGVGVAAAMQALTTMVIISGPLHLATQAHIWLAGSVNGTNWKMVLTATAVIVILLLVLFGSTRKLNLLEFGDDIAKGAGIRHEWERAKLVTFSTLLAGTAVAFAGNIGFVGLMAPHMARKLVGSAHGSVLPVSGLLGGLLVAGADLAGRTVFAPLEVPAGIFTSALGAPYFIWLLYRTRNH